MLLPLQYKPSVNSEDYNTQKSNCAVNAMVICVGNAVVGGSGKTPACLALAKKFKNVAFILRGYKGSLNNSIKFNSPSGTYTEQLTPGMYNVVELRTSLNTLLNQYDAGSFNVTFSYITGKITIQTISAGSYFTFHNVNNSLREILGYADTSLNYGVGYHEADYIINLVNKPYFIYISEFGLQGWFGPSESPKPYCFFVPMNSNKLDINSYIPEDETQIISFNRKNYMKNSMSII